MKFKGWVKINFFKFKDNKDGKVFVRRLLDKRLI